MWRAVLLTLLLQSLARISARHFMLKFDDAIDNGLPAWHPVKNTGIFTNEIMGDGPLYIQELQRMIEDFIILPFAYYWQCWLERTFPGSSG